MVFLFNAVKAAKISEFASTTTQRAVFIAGYAALIHCAINAPLPIVSFCVSTVALGYHRPEPVITAPDLWPSVSVKLRFGKIHETSAIRHLP